MVVVGAKGFAKEVLEELYLLGKANEHLAFFDNVSTDIPDKLYDRFPVLRNEADVKSFFEKHSAEFTLGIGNPAVRHKLSHMFESWGGDLTSIISPHSFTGHFGSTIGKGASMLVGSWVSNDVTIGKGCLLNVNCGVGHDVTIGDFVEIAPGVRILGGCTVGSYCMISTNATIVPKVKIGNNVIIGPGVVVGKNVKDGDVVMTMPGRVVAKNKNIVSE